jgi:hypothetical protein
MSQFGQFLVNPLWNVGGFLIGVVGIVLAVFYYMRSRRLIRLSYSLRRFTIFGENVGTLPGLSISCGGKPISKLFDYRMLIWNSGSKVVHPSSFASSDPLRIQLGSECNSVVGVNILGASTSANHVTVLMQVPDQISIDFEYLDRKQGAVLSILSDAELWPPPRLEGIVKGGAIVEITGIRETPLSDVIICATAFGFGPTLIGGILQWVGPLVAYPVGIVILAIFIITGWRMFTTARKPGCDPRLKETFDHGFHKREFRRVRYHPLNPPTTHHPPSLFRP